MDHDPITIKRNIKQLATSKGLLMKDIHEHLGITRAGLSKAMASKNFPYSKWINDIASFLSCSVNDILGIEEKTIKGNNSNEELITLRAENRLLKDMVSKQDEDIKFLRGLLSRGGNLK